MLIEKDLLTAQQAAAVTGPRRQGRPTNPATIRRWCTVGLRGVILEHEERGGVFVTTRAALEEFWQKCREAKRAALDARRERERDACPVPEGKLARRYAKSSAEAAKL